MNIYKAYQFRMYPTNEQIDMLNQFLGSSRFIYNYYLSYQMNAYTENKKLISIGDLKKNILKLKETYPWLKEIDSSILRTSLDDLDRAFTNYFHHSGYPKFKKKGNNESYRTICIRSTYKDKSYENIKVNLENKTITLPKIGSIKIRGYRNKKSFPFKIINVTVKKEAGKYYACVCVEEEVITKPLVPKNIIGIDIGIKDLVVTSDAVKYQAFANIKKNERKIKGYQKALVRSKRGGNNRKKIIIKLQRYYQKLRNARKYYLHLITTTLVKENDIIVCETLKVKEMIERKKHHLAKSIANSSFGEIIRQLTYKTKWKNKKLYQIDTYYPSSQICSVCGNRMKELKNLEIRCFECRECKNELDRDVNASINILTEGIKMYIKELNLL